MILSMGAGFTLEEIYHVSPKGLRWLNLYILQDKEWMRKLIKEAEELDFKAFVVTVDTTVMGNRRSVMRKKGPKPVFGMQLPLFTGQKKAV